MHFNGGSLLRDVRLFHTGNLSLARFTEANNTPPFYVYHHVYSPEIDLNEQNKVTVYVFSITGFHFLLHYVQIPGILY